MTVAFCLVLLSFSAFADGMEGFRLENLLDDGIEERDLEYLAKEAMKTGKDEFVTALPQHYRWIRVGSSSVDVGWDVDALRGLRANEMNLTAYCYTNSINYVYRAVPFSRGKLTLDRLKPSTFYEMVIQPMKSGIPIHTHTAYLKTPAEGNGAAMASIGLTLLAVVFGLALLA